MTKRTLVMDCELYDFLRELLEQPTVQQSGRIMKEMDDELITRAYEFFHQKRNAKKVKQDG